jgi:SAM-dependent methyltransferase
MARALVYNVPEECEACPACASPRLFDLDLIILVVNGRRQTGFVSGCDECGLVFTNPQPTPDDLRRFYKPDGEWRTPRAAEASDADRPASRSWSRPFAPMSPGLPVTAPPAGARVLDFGCGTGRLLDELQACGWETSGIDPAIDRAFGRHRRLDAVPDAPTFDLIVANHVLEHVANPLQLLRAFARAARDGGYLYVGVPRFDTLPAHRDYKYVINGRAHVVAFTWPCLHGLLARSGWAAVAPPPDVVAKGGGRTTRARLQVVARRTAGERPLPDSPADAARDALRQYHAGVPGRPLLERAGFYRLAARRIAAHQHKRTVKPHREPVVS